jgi:hypothetical protein
MAYCEECISLRDALIQKLVTYSASLQSAGADGVSSVIFGPIGSAVTDANGALMDHLKSNHKSTQS